MISTVAAALSVALGLLIKILDFVLDQKRKKDPSDNSVFVSFLMKRNETLESELKDIRTSFARLESNVQSMSIKPMREKVLSDLRELHSKMESTTAVAIMASANRKGVSNVKINLASLLRSLPAKQVAVFVLNLAADILEALDADRVGIDDATAQALRAASEAIRDTASNDRAIDAMASILPSVPTMNETDESNQENTDQPYSDRD